MKATSFMLPMARSRNGRVQKLQMPRTMTISGASTRGETRMR